MECNYLWGKSGCWCHKRDLKGGSTVSPAGGAPGPTGTHYIESGLRSKDLTRPGMFQELSGSLTYFPDQWKTGIVRRIGVGEAVAEAGLVLRIQNRYARVSIKKEERGLERKGNQWDPAKNPQSG